MMIFIPMILIAVTLPFYYEPLLNGDPRNVLRLAGVLMFVRRWQCCGSNKNLLSILVLRLARRRRQSDSRQTRIVGVARVIFEPQNLIARFAALGPLSAGAARR